MKRLPRHDDRRTPLFRACVIAAACACAPIVGAQETRVDLLAQERAAKAQQADGSSVGVRLDRIFAFVESRLQDWSGDGLHPVMGGMIPGDTFAIGPGYQRHLFGHRAVVDAFGAGSMNQSLIVGSRLEWQHFFADRISVGADFKYQDFKQINFFGIGGSSLKTSQTNYRLTDVDVRGFADVRATRRLSIRGRVGVLRSVGIGAGTDSLSPPTENRFDAVAAPGLTRQPDFLHADVSLDVDTRDVPAYPSRGGRYRLTVASFQDQNLGQYSFRRLDADAAHYLPLFHKSRVLTLHGRATFSQAAAGQEVPFYLLPTLGGSNSLRGFLDYRFRDRNLVLFNAEYRWSLFRAMDGALFYDAGVVAPTLPALSLRRAVTDYGLGIRLHTSRHTLFRVDVARSHEGIRTSVAFTAPFGAPSRSVVPFMP